MSRAAAVRAAAFALAVAVVGGAVAAGSPDPTPQPDGPTADSRLRLRLKPLPDDTRRVWLEADADGREWFMLLKTDGATERLSPDDFAARLEHDTRGRGLLFALLNITSSAGVLWVALGLAGQVLFTGRMVLQWLVSERSRRSVVPVGFWWMSLGGATMLLVYFVWRRDIVGVLGQSTGWFIYLRNLWMIYRDRSAAASGSSRDR